LQTSSIVIKGLGLKDKEKD